MATILANSDFVNFISHSGPVIKIIINPQKWIYDQMDSLQVLNGSPFKMITLRIIWIGKITKRKVKHKVWMCAQQYNWEVSPSSFSSFKAFALGVNCHCLTVPTIYKDTFSPTWVLGMCLLRNISRCNIFEFTLLMSYIIRVSSFCQC